MAVGGNRAIRRGHRTALDGKPRGTALTEQDGAARTAGSGLRLRRARAEPRSCEPSCGRRKRASRDLAEQGRQRRMELVGVNPPRHAEHVRDVFRSSASGGLGL